jgi:4-amino-4-deoxy-L-arabinose transferase-like glycosyltransferase
MMDVRTSTMTHTSRVLLVLTSVWFIAAAAFGTRLAFSWDQQRKIPHQVLATLPFDQEAGSTAFALSQGKGFSNLFRQNTGPTAWLAPLFPFLLSLIFRVFGAYTISSFFAAVLMNVLFSTLTTFPLFALVRHISGRGTAVAAAGLWVFLPAGILMPFEWIWDTSLSVLLATTILWLTLRASESRNSSLWLSYGLVCGVALLTNPTVAIVLPFLWFWAVRRARNIAGIPWHIPALALALIFLTCLPWTLRNFATFHRLIPIRSSLPFEFWIGNNDIFDPHAIGGIQRITRYEEIRRYAQLGETAYLQDKSDLATIFIRQKPGLFLQLTSRKIIATWIGTEHPIADFLQADSLLAGTVIVCNFVLTLGTVLGVWFLVRLKSPFTFPVAIFPLLYPVVYYFTHTSLRYRHPIDPILLFLTIAAIAGIRRSFLARVAESSASA